MQKPEQFAKSHPGAIVNSPILSKYWHKIKWGENPESIIEVGIGDGSNTKLLILPRLPKNIKEYVGIDISKAALDYAKTIIHHPAFITQQLDICAEEIPEAFQNRFDKVFAFLVFHTVSTKLE